MLRPGRTLRGEQFARPARLVILESFLIALSIVLALFAHRWQEGRENAQLAERAMRGIQDELTMNRKAAQESLDYHSGLLQLLMRPGATQPTSAEFPRGFVMPAQLLSTGWDTAVATDAVSHFDYEDVLSVSRVYSDQERYDTQSLAVSQIIYSELYTRGHEGFLENYANLASIIGTFAYRERQLVELYDATLSDITAATP